MKIISSRFLSVCLFILMGGLVLSCSKDKDTPSGKAHDVQFKIVTSAGSNIQLAVYGVDNDFTTESSIAGTEWESEIIKAPAGSQVLTLNSQGIGADASSTMKVQIYVDGKLKKEGNSSGEILAASASVGL